MVLGAGDTHALDPNTKIYEWLVCPSPLSTYSSGHIVPRPRPPQQPRTATAHHRHSATQHPRPPAPGARSAGEAGEEAPVLKHFPLGRLEDQLRTCLKYSRLFPKTAAATPSAALHVLRGGAGCVLGQLSEGVGGSSVILPGNTGHWRENHTALDKDGRSLSTHAPSVPFMT